MDRFAAMLILLGLIVSIVLMILALFAVAPVVCSCLLSLIYTLYLFLGNEESGVHHAQEFENRFWTIFAMLFSTAMFFAHDSPIALGHWSPSLGFFGVVFASYAMHIYDRYVHRLSISRQTNLRRSISDSHRLHEIGISLNDQLKKIDNCLRDIDQLLIPSTINNFINERFVLRKEREIISVFYECDAVALNHLIASVKLGLLIYKIKDHRSFSGQHRTELIQLLAVDRLPALTVMSRVIVLHALQMLKLRANPRAEFWVRNILLNTHQEDLSEVKTLTDAKGDYFCMNKLIFDDIRSESIRQDILSHIRREAAVQQTLIQSGSKRSKKRQSTAYRKVLSDVDDTLTCSGGHYPAGIDKRYAKRVVYPGVLAFYRELDLGTKGPEEWPDNRVGNLVFLSARPHVYKDMSEKQTFAKFEKLRMPGEDGRKGMHTVPSLLAGDLKSGSHFIATSDCEPLAKKKFENFKRYVAIYPEYQHVFVCDNGQGDVRAGEMMFDSFPYEFEALYVHKVQSLSSTYGYAPERWKAKEFEPCFFETYPEAALHAATRKPPLIQVSGLQRVCIDAIKDFHLITIKQWQSQKQKAERRAELNQAIWRCNNFLKLQGYDEVSLIEAERLWMDNERVRTPYGTGIVKGFDPQFDLYKVELDWRPLDKQIEENIATMKKELVKPPTLKKATSLQLETVIEDDEVTDDEESEDRVANKKTLYSKRHSLALPLAKSKSSSAVTSVKRTTTTTAAVANVSDATKFDTISTVDENIAVNAQAIDDKASSLEPSSVEDAQTVVDSGDRHGNGNDDDREFRVMANIQGRLLSKYTPPTLPKIDKKSSLFSFWTGTATDVRKKKVFKAGDDCSTPFGPATVIEYRESQGFVVVDMIGWKARGYIQESNVKVISKSILASFFRRQSSKEDTTPPKPPSFPYAKGTIITTPFGEGSVIRPLALEEKQDSASAIAQSNAYNTIAISLTSWKLANGKNATIYCTVETAKTWKDNKSHGDRASSNLLSAFGSLVSSTLDFAGRFSAQKTKEDVNTPIPKFTRYYCDSTPVSTLFGDGVILKFRENDGFYTVSLTAWKLANGSYATAFMRKDDISYRIAKGCREGYPVLTSLGLSGKLESVVPTTGVHIVICPSAGLVMYLQPESVLQPLKAAVGEDVLTAYGEGNVEYYNKSEDTYRIKLVGWNARLYAKAETFDRVGDSMRDREGPFGMNWLLGFFFASTGEGNKNESTTRSRSNSIVSTSARSQSGRSQS